MTIRPPRPLDDRKATVLRAVVVEHIRTAEPVGSGAVARRYRLRVSPATIRNDMAALEELGYLVQPHTSAGRIPTDSGYRYYVDTLPTDPETGDAERQAIAGFFGDPAPDVDEVLRGTTQLLSRLTHLAALALAPSLYRSTVATIDLLRVGSSWLLVVVTEPDRVEKRRLEGVSDLPAPIARRIGRALADASGGRSLPEAETAVRELARAAAGDERTTLETAADALASMGRGDDPEHVIVGGAANIAGDEGFDRRTVERVFRALDREREVLRLLLEATDRHDVTIRIGRENPITGMWETSVIVAPYRSGQRILGTIGVIGPTRMDYLGNISTVLAVARRLSEAVAPLAG